MVSIQIIKILRKEEKRMKKLLSLVLIGTLALSLTACGNSSSKDNSSSKETTTTKKEEKKEPLDLTGTWKSDENEGTWMEATISDKDVYKRQVCNTFLCSLPKFLAISKLLTSI